MSFKVVINDLKKLADPEKAKFFPRFFKAGPGGYAEGDKFFGVTVPKCQSIAAKYKDLPLTEIQNLLKSEVHEARLTALTILVNQYKKAKGVKGKENIFNFYLENTKYINNWDLVDMSAAKIIGDFIYDKPKNILYSLANSKNLWEKRISIISTYMFIKKDEFEDTLKISKILLNDSHDLIHKAVGWMLREVGKKNMSVEKKFLKVNYKKMPRTMLRYAIEKLPEKTRLRYLTGKV